MAGTTPDDPAWKDVQFVPAKRKMNLAIIACGIGSTVLTFVVVEMIRSAGTDPMLFFADYVIPIGSLGVGGIAGIGYGVGSWLTQTRLNGKALLLMAVLHTIAWALLYVAAWWAMCKPGTEGEGVGFFTWFDVMTRSIQFTSHGHTDDALGVLGYGIRLGEIVGFVFGGMIAPGILMAKPYCEPCQRYLKSKHLFALPAAGEYKTFAKKATLEAANAPIRERLADDTKRLHEAITAGDSKQVVAVIQSVAPNSAPNSKVKDWLKLVRHRCPGCGVGFIDLNLTDNNGQDTKQVARYPVTSDMLHAVEDVSASLPALRAAKT